MVTSSPLGPWSFTTHGEPTVSSPQLLFYTRHNVLYTLTHTPLVISLRAILHNPTIYPEPSKFKPERFLDPASRPPFPEAGFGFGRRKCPGRLIALDILWISMANMLAAFEFLPATDADGRPCPPAPEFAIRVAL